MFFSKYYVV